MLRLIALVSTLFVLCSLTHVPVAFADTWGCSYEKCLQVCGKTGGTRCSAYCTKQLKDKQTSKVCK